jgi:ribonuclease-3
LLADVFEAVLGAIYLDGGLRPARAFLWRHLKTDLRYALETRVAREDFKSALQEATQARLQCTPHYRIVSATGPDHAREFEAEVLVEGEVLGRGTGSNRKRAEQQAAREALGHLTRTEG